MLREVLKVLVKKIFLKTLKKKKQMIFLTVFIYLFIFYIFSDSSIKTFLK